MRGVRVRRLEVHGWGWEVHERGLGTVETAAVVGAMALIGMTVGKATRLAVMAVNKV